MFCCAPADYDWVEHISSTCISVCDRAIHVILRKKRVNTKEQSNLVFPYKHSKRLNLAKCKKEFVLCWGLLNSTITRLSNITTIDETADDNNSSGLV
jgi:hypothetical protein